MRVGNEEYAKTNKSYGLTTLRNRHVKLEGASRISFDFRGKHGTEHHIDLRDKRLASIVRRCQELPGQELFQYLDDDWHAACGRFRRCQRVSARYRGRRNHRQGFSHLGRNQSGSAGAAGA